MVLPVQLLVLPMAEIVLEVVYIDEYEAERFLGAGHALYLVVDGPQHVAPVRKSGEFVGPRNQVEFLVRFLEFLRTFLHFLFKHFPVRVQFRNLSLDGMVHDVEVLREDSYFACVIYEK